MNIERILRNYLNYKGRMLSQEEFCALIKDEDVNRVFNVLFFD